MTRDERILTLKPVVVHLAHKMQLRYGGDIEEMLGDAWVGAIQAVDRYDPQNEPGASLATFAKHRITGAVLDGMRARDFLSVAHRRALVASDSERPPFPVSIEAHNDLGISLVDNLIDLATTRRVEGLARELTIGAEIELLPTRQAYVLRQHYWAERSYTAIGADLGVTQARVSQLAKQAHVTLAKHL